MIIRFEVGGESPEIGRFKAGEERDIHEDLARLFIGRRLAVEVKPANTAPEKTAAKKEVKDNG